MAARRAPDAADAPAPVGGHAQAVEVGGVARGLLFVSGRVPMAADGTVPATFEGQCRQTWANAKAQLRAAGMTLDDVVKVTTFLADRRHGGENGEVRRSVLGGRRVAPTVVAGILDEGWLVEIEAGGGGLSRPPRPRPAARGPRRQPLTSGCRTWISRQGRSAGPGPRMPFRCPGDRSPREGGSRPPASA